MNQSQVAITSATKSANGSEFAKGWLEQLTTETTLHGLPAFEFTVGPEVLTFTVDRQLGASPQFPGVVVADGERLLGMISRPMLFAQLSRPFRQELGIRSRTGTRTRRRRPRIARRGRQGTPANRTPMAERDERVNRRQQFKNRRSIGPHIEKLGRQRRIKNIA